MKLGLAVITAFLAKSCCAVPAMTARQANLPDPSGIGLNLNQLGGVLHDLTNIINVPLDGNSYPLGDLLRQAGISGSKDTRLSGLQANAQSHKFNCDIDLNVGDLAHINSEQSILSFLSLPEFRDGLKLADLENANVTCNNL